MDGGETAAAEVFRQQWSLCDINGDRVQDFCYLRPRSLSGVFGQVRTLEDTPTGGPDTTVHCDPRLGCKVAGDPLRVSEPEQLVTAHPSASAYANNNPLVQVDREEEFAYLAAAAVVVGIVVGRRL